MDRTPATPFFSNLNSVLQGAFCFPSCSHPLQQPSVPLQAAHSPLSPAQMPVPLPVSATLALLCLWGAWAAAARPGAAPAWSACPQQRRRRRRRSSPPASPAPSAPCRQLRPNSPESPLLPAHASAKRPLLATCPRPPSSPAPAPARPLLPLPMATAAAAAARREGPSSPPPRACLRFCMRSSTATRLRRTRGLRRCRPRMTPFTTPRRVVRWPCRRTGADGPPPRHGLRPRGSASAPGPHPHCLQEFQEMEARWQRCAHLALAALAPRGAPPCLPG